MGNCCGTASGNFSGQGRTLDGQDEEPARLTNTATPARRQPAAVSQAGRKLGTANAQDTLSPKEAAARAAEARAAAQGPGKGVLSQKLNQQRQQSQSATLAQGAKDNLAARDADAATQARNYN